MRNFISENRNLIVFLICSVISSAIWMSMSLSKTYNKAFTVKVVFENVPTNKKINSDTIDVKATIKAKGWDLAFKKVEGKIVKINLDKYNIKETLEFTDLKTIIQENEDKLQIVEISPPTYRLNFENLVSKKVPIKLQVKKNFSSNYFFFKEPQLQPDSVTISSDENSIKMIEYVFSEEITISEKDYFLENVQITKNDKYKLDYKTFNVKFDIKEFVEKEFTVEVNIDNNKNDVELIIFPEQIQLKCLVPITIYENISVSDFYISADFNNIEVQKNNKLLLTVKEEPEFVRNIQLQKDQVEFIIYQ